MASNKEFNNDTEQTTPNDGYIAPPSSPSLSTVVTHITTDERKNVGAASSTPELHPFPSPEMEHIIRPIEQLLEESSEELEVRPLTYAPQVPRRQYSSEAMRIRGRGTGNFTTTLDDQKTSNETERTR